MIEKLSLIYYFCSTLRTIIKMSGLVLGKLAFVTGAGSGIGRATCQVLAREGAQVIAADKNLKSAEETIATLSKTPNNDNSIGHSSVLIDVSDSNSIKSSLNNILGQFKKPPSIVVNCAGITRDNFILKLSEEDFDDVINVNLKGTFLLMKIFGQAIIEKNVQESSFITIGSIVAKNGNMGQANYCASKAGVDLVTKTAAREFSKYGIRCNSVVPGFIATPMTDIVPEKVKEKMMPLISCRRMGRPEEVAEMITFLASSKSSYVNGASIDINGGMSI